MENCLLKSEKFVLENQLQRRKLCCLHVFVVRWKSAIERGENKGWWENAAVQGTGKLHLLMDDFDPTCKLHFFKY